MGQGWRIKRINHGAGHRESASAVSARLEGHHDLREHPAVLMVQTSNPGQIWEAVSTNWGSERYMAVYVRPINATPDPAAEAAIRTLCLKRG